MHLMLDRLDILDAISRFQPEAKCSHAHFPAQLSPLTTIWFLSAILPPGLVEDTKTCEVIDGGNICI